MTHRSLEELGSDQMLTTGEAGELLRVGRAAVVRWCDAGKLDFIRTPCGHRRIPLRAVTDILGKPGDGREN